MQLIVALLILALDQVSKFVLSGEAIRNTGVAFGLFQSETSALSTIFVGLIALVVAYEVMRHWEKWLRITRTGASILLAGITSNLIDRVRVGAVIDPLSIGNWFPHFNLADTAVIAGLIIIVTTMRKRRMF